MSAPVPFPLGNKWRKRKRDNSSLLTNNKKHRPEDEDEDEEDIDDEIEAEEDEDLHPIPSSFTTNTASELQHSSREHEVLSDGGVRISDFPLVIEHTVNRPHSSVLSIVAAEKSLLNRNQNPTFFLENISHGQLQALSSVPIDNPSLNPSSSSDNDRSDGSSSSSFVCTPPPIMEGRGVIKRFSNNRVLVVPMHADWFSPNSIHRLERQVVPHFFSGKSGDHTPEKYMECRNQIVGKYMVNPEKRLWTTDCQGLVGGVDVHDLNRIVRFLDHWGIINYSAEAPNREPRIGGPFLREDTNGEVHIPSSALRSIYSLIHFDKPKSRIKPEDICSFGGEDGADLDNRIRERLSENHCNYCSKSLTGVHYQSQKEADILLCSACFHEGRFVVGHSSTDFARVDFAKALCDLDGDSWTDQETLLLLEAVEIYSDSWNDIAEHVGTKSKAQCILHFIRLPMEDGILENIDVPSKSVSSNVPNIEDHARPYANSNGGSSMSSIPNFHSSNKKTLCLQDLDSESRLPFANSSNPVMALVAFLASSVGPRVAAACAHASLASLSKEDYQLDTSGSIMQAEGSSDRISTESTRSKEGGLQGSTTSLKHPKEETQAAQGSVHESHALFAPLPPESVKIAAKLGLAAAAMKAKLFADHEEREIQRMAASIINHQLKRLELKLKQFAEVETLLMKEGENVERTRQRLAAERVRIISTRFLPGGAAPTTSSPAMPGAAGSPVSVANNLVNNRQQVISASPAQTNISGYANSPATHPHMSFMQRQQPMFTFGPRLPLSAIHPSSSTTHPTTVMFSAAPGNTTPTLTSHPMLRPVSGTNSNAG